MLNLALLAVASAVLATPGHGAPKKPLYGLCAAKRCNKNAASGYVDASGKRYCKTCFRQVCPKAYAKKQAKRKFGG